MTFTLVLFRLLCVKSMSSIVRQFEKIFVLSPHLDDAIFSCGSFIRSYSKKLPVTVINVASGDPDVILRKESQVLEVLAQKGGHELAHPKVRRLEDRKALRMAGCQLIHLGFIDAAYRRNPHTGRLIYPDNVMGFDFPRPEDDSYQQELQTSLRALTQNMEKTLVLSPMGIGNHVDHVIVRNIALTLQSKNTTVLFYEDFPYVVHAGREEAQNKITQREAIKPLGLKVGSLLTHTVNVSEKQKLVLNYKTQIKMIFGSKEKMKRDLNTRRLHNKVVECFWELKK